MRYIAATLFFFGCLQARAEPNEDQVTAAPTSPEQAGPNLWSAGLGARLPDGLPLEITRRLDERLSLRGWISAPLGLTLNERQDPEVESFYETVSFATPATQVQADVKYGPALGVDALYHPFSSAFFVAGGISYYQVVGRAEKATPLLICFDTSKACTAETAAYRTNSELEIKAVAKESGARLSASAGWLWNLGERWYTGLTVGGLSYRAWTKRHVSVDSTMGDDPSLSDLTKEQMQYVLPTKEKKLEGQITRKMDEYNRRVLPVIGLTAGFRF